MAPRQRQRRRPSALKVKAARVGIRIEVPTDLKDELDALRDRAAALGAEIDLRDLFAAVLEDCLVPLADQIEELEQDHATRLSRRSRSAVRAGAAEPAGTAASRAASLTPPAKPSDEAPSLPLTAAAVEGSVSAPNGHDPDVSPPP